MLYAAAITCAGPPERAVEFLAFSAPPRPELNGSAFRNLPAIEEALPLDIACQTGTAIPPRSKNDVLHTFGRDNKRREIGCRSVAPPPVNCFIYLRYTHLDLLPAIRHSRKAAPTKTNANSTAGNQASEIESSNSFKLIRKKYSLRLQQRQKRAEHV